MTRVLVIGGTGLIGPWVLSGLRELKSGVDLWVMDRRGQGPDGVKALRGDRHDPAAVRAALDVAKPEVLIDMIAFSKAEAEATVEVLREHGAPTRTVAVSSADVYEAFSRLNGLIGGPPETGPITEDSPLRVGEGAQGAAYDKLAVEQIYAAALENVAVLRLPAVYGWPDQSRIEAYAGPMLDGAAEVVLHPRLARWRFARVFNRNAGHAVALAALGDWSGLCAWNVAEPISLTEAEWVARICQATGWRGRIAESDAAESPSFDADQPITLSDARIRLDLGYHERHDPEDGLRDTVRRYAEWRARKS